VDESVRSRLRPAHRRGLTSPDPVTATPRPRATRQTATADPDQRTRTSRRASERQETHVRVNNKIGSTHPAPRKRSPEFTRWIEAKVSRPLLCAAGFSEATQLAAVSLKLVRRRSTAPP
jgi:hypothetical protein